MNVTTGNRGPYGFWPTTDSRRPTTACLGERRTNDEFIAIYWKCGRAPLSGQVKKGLAAAFPKFDEYQLAKYDRGGFLKLRDVLFLCHAKPRDEAQAAVWKRLIWGPLTTPDTWEVALSAAGDGAARGADKREAWERLLREQKLGALALLRNLRNMREAGVSEKLVIAALREMKTDRVLPFRFIAAARYAPQHKPELEQAMFRSLKNQPPLPGTTALVVTPVPRCGWRGSAETAIRIASKLLPGWPFCCARLPRE
jgi:60 kDa SS-A/Ro ribonucleoprotein